MTWLDLEGKPPSVDADGKLTKPFILRLLDGDGAIRAYELWTVGLKLPDTPAAFAKWATEIQAARDKRLGVKTQEDAGEATAFKVTRTGKRKRKADNELTAAQLKRRRYNQQRNAEKKRRVQ